MTPPRSPALAAIGMTLDRSTGVPVSRQIYRAIREAILAGQLSPGVRLPSSRALAAELGVSRTTTLYAYERLRDEGYLEGRVGAGTTVALLRVPRPVSTARDASGPQPRLSAQGAGLAGIRWWTRGTAEAAVGTPPRAFSVGQPALDAFPTDLWTRLLARRLRRSAHSLLNYQSPAGYRPLREAIAAYVGMARGVRCGPDQVLVVSGAQAALSLVARLLLDHGDEAWVEDPGYYGARGAIVSAGATPVPVPVDHEGLDVDAGRRRAPNARLGYVTPSHQFPLGVVMSLTRRLAVLEHARDTGMYVVEDDYDSEYRYVGDPLPSLQGLDRAGRVIYVGSFSKVLFPALRIGFVIVPDQLVDAFLTGQRFAAVHAPVLEQATLADFIAEGHFARHVRRMRTLYAQRAATLTEAIRRELGGLLTVTSPDAGLHLAGWLPPGTDDTAAAIRASRHGVEVQPVSAHALEPYGRPGLLLGYAATTEAEIVAGVRRLAAALSGGRPASPTPRRVRSGAPARPRTR